MGALGGFIHGGRKRHDGLHPFQRPGKPHNAWKTVQGVGAIHDQQLHLAGHHAVHDFFDFAERRRGIDLPPPSEDHCLADVPGHVIEQVDGDLGFRGAGGGQGGASRDGEARGGGGKFLGQFFQCPGIGTGILGGPGEGVGLEVLGEPGALRGGNAPLAPLQNALGQCQGDDRLAAGFDVHPLVGVGSGEGEMGADVDEFSLVLAPVVIGVHLRIALGVFHRVLPCFQKIAAKIEQQGGCLDPVLGNFRPPKSAFVGGANAVTAQRVQHHLGRGAQFPQPCIEETGAAAGGVAGDVDDAPLAGGPQHGHELLLGILPGDVLPAILAAPSGLGIAGRIVMGLQGGLAADAKRAPAQGVVRIAFRLDGAGLAGFHDHAAVGRAFHAGGGVIEGNAGRELHVVGRHQVGDQFLRLVRATGHGRHGSAYRYGLEKLASVHSLGHDQGLSWVVVQNNAVRNYADGARQGFRAKSFPGQ